MNFSHFILAKITNFITHHLHERQYTRTRRQKNQRNQFLSQSASLQIDPNENQIHTDYSACHTCINHHPLWTSQLNTGKLAWVSKNSGKLAADALSDRLASRLHLRPVTRCVGEDRIRRARERDEDIAIFSMIPLEGDPGFRCCLGIYCLLGDPRRAEPGDLLKIGWEVISVAFKASMVYLNNQSQQWPYITVLPFKNEIIHNYQENRSAINWLQSHASRLISQIVNYPTLPFNYARQIYDFLSFVS